MAMLLNDKDEVVAQIERNKTRVRLGLCDGPSPYLDEGIREYAERWLGMEEVTWLIDQLVQARRGIRAYNAAKSIRGLGTTALKATGVSQKAVDEALQALKEHLKAVRKHNIHLPKHWGEP